MMRLIDADALMERYGKPCHSFQDVIEDMPTIDVAPKWVSVKDRLPVKPGEYLASSNEYVTVLEFEGGKWHDFSGARYFVDAWMDKPEGYKLHDWDGESDDDGC